MTTKITQLTPEQEALIPVYREKWRSITISTEPIDPVKTSDAVELVYSTLGLEKPIILFCRSPKSALESIIEIPLFGQLGNYLEFPIWSEIRKHLLLQLFNKLWHELGHIAADDYDDEAWAKREKLKRQMGIQDTDDITYVNELYDAVWTEIEQEYWKQLLWKRERLEASEPESIEWKQCLKKLSRQDWQTGHLWENGNSLNPCRLGCRLLDFCFSVLNFSHDPKKWSALKSLASECGWFFPFEKICFVCDRPIKLSVDSQDRPHAEGEPAIQFADGFCVYANHGYRLPEKYRELNPNQWSPEWIANERDIYLRQALIRAVSPIKIDRITPEQESLIPTIRDKWRNYALSTEPIDRHKAEEAVKAAYRAIGAQEPKVLFCDSPFSVFETAARYALVHDWFPSLWEEICSLDYNSIGYLLYAPDYLQPNQLIQHLRYQLIEQLEEELAGQIEWPVRWQLKSELLPDQRTFEQMRSLLEAAVPRRLIQTKGQLLKLAQLVCEDQLVWSYNQEIAWHILMTKELPNFMRCYGYISPEILVNPLYGEPLLRSASFIDFCITVLNLSHNSKKWSVFESLFQNCGSILALKKICVVSDRPRILSFDNQSRLHAEGSPAIQFADGFSVYAYHGVILPEKYEKVHPNDWQSQWLLSEKNAELRRVLIQGIGYARICQELQAAELDTWQEYTLLTIESDIDVEPIYLLKMTCPSTGFIHALRVPPDVKSAREAITWVNWGITPEEFSVQT